MAFDNLTDDITDDEHGKTDGCLARTNTVTTCGKAEATGDGLDVAACFSRLQSELRTDEELDIEEAEAEELAQKEMEEREENRRRAIDKIWMERGEWMRAVEPTSSIDSRLHDFLHNPESMDSIVGAAPGTLYPGEPRAESEPGDELPSGTSMHPTTPNGGEGLFTESSAPESVREPAVPTKFEWGTGPVPGEERYSSRPKNGCCVVS